MAAFALSLSLACNASEAFDGSCGAELPTPHAAAQAWPSNDRLYRFDNDLRLVRSAFDGGESAIVSAHEFEYAPRNVDISADGRFVSYGGELKGGGSQWWLLDAVSGRERLLLGDIPSRYTFSGDSRSLAFFLAPQKAETAQAKRAGLYIVDLESGREKSAGWPASSAFRPGPGTTVSLEWFKDGRLLLRIAEEFRSDQEKPVEYWRFDPAARKFQRIEGRNDQAKRSEEYLLDGSVLPLARDPEARFILHGGLHSEGDRFYAFVDKEHRLVVQEGENKRVVATGSYNECEGDTLWLFSWIEGDRYLLYYLDSRPYLLDPRSGNSLALDVGPGRQPVFFWARGPAGLAPN